MILKGRKIILGISGSIAAYKSALIARLLIKEGAEVQVIMTPAAKEFITPLTLSTLTQKGVISEFFETNSGTWNSHVDLGLWADLMLIAPATASTIAKMANGIADNMLITSYLSSRSPVFVAPAMDLDMFRHPSTLKNIETIKLYGNIIIEPAEGELASGLSGKGRMEEPEIIVQRIKSFFESRQKLSGKKFLVTAGPTYESIDTVRFIGNYSSGKMGYAIAEELANLGASVKLVSGPVKIECKHPQIEVIKVRSASEMFQESIQHFPKMDVAIMAAAVADFTPVETSNVKIKRKDQKLSIELKPTQDIAAELGRMKTPSQFLIGFALESENEEENAKEKIKKKNLDLIVLNSLKDEGAGFNFDTNKITIIDKLNNIFKFELKSKVLVAKDIVLKITSLFDQ